MKVHRAELNYPVLAAGVDRLTLAATDGYFLSHTRDGLVIHEPDTDPKVIPWSGVRFYQVAKEDLPKPLTCNECGETFRNQSGLATHQKLKHKPEPKPKARTSRGRAKADA